MPDPILDSGPSYTTPTPNPRDTGDLGRSMRPEFTTPRPAGAPSLNPLGHDANSGLEESRVHPDATRHPETGRITRPFQVKGVKP